MSDSDSGSIKTIVVLGRRDHAEAMRVASGVTVFGHQVRLVLMDRAVEETDEVAEQAEMLELAGIVPVTTVPASDQLESIGVSRLAEMLAEADFTLSI